MAVKDYHHDPVFISQIRKIGHKIFPTAESDALRQSSKVIHYAGTPPIYGDRFGNTGFVPHHHHHHSQQQPLHSTSELHHALMEATTNTIRYDPGNAPIKHFEQRPAKLGIDTDEPPHAAEGDQFTSPLSPTADEFPSPMSPEADGPHAPPPDCADELESEESSETSVVLSRRQSLINSDAVDEGALLREPPNPEVVMAPAYDENLYSLPDSKENSSTLNEVVENGYYDTAYEPLPPQPSSEGQFYFTTPPTPPTTRTTFTARPPPTNVLVFTDSMSHTQPATDDSVYYAEISKEDEAVTRELYDIVREQSVPVPAHRMSKDDAALMRQESASSSTVETRAEAYEGASTSGTSRSESTSVDDVGHSRVYTVQDDSA